MAQQQDPLLELMRQELFSLRDEIGRKSYQEIKLTIEESCRKNRHLTWMGEGGVSSALDYLHFVIRKHAELRPYIQAVQVERSDEVWGPLFETLQRKCTVYLLRKGFYRGPATEELAIVYTTEAVFPIVQSIFPYDVEFLPWATATLINVCRRHMRTALLLRNSPELPDVSYEMAVEDGWEMGSLDNLGSLEYGDMLQEAIQELPTSWQEVMMCRYYYYMTPAEIVDETGKTASAIYNIHSKALKRLHDILRDKGF